MSELHLQLRQVTSAIYHIFGFEQIEFRIRSNYLERKSPIHYMNKIKDGVYLYAINGKGYISALDGLRINLLKETDSRIPLEDLHIINVFSNMRPISKKRESIQKSIDFVLSNEILLKRILQYCYDNNIEIKDDYISDDVKRIAQVELEVNHRL